MRKLIIILSLFSITAILLLSQQSEFPKLTGPYLGQKPPGKIPVIFAPGIISTGLNEGACSFMPDGSEIVFAVIYRKPHSQKIFSSLVRSKMENGSWLPPEVLKFSGSSYMDAYPFISYDGKELFFQSDRPTERDDLKDKYNIWSSKRINDDWSAPEPLPAPINGRGDVSGPSMSKSGTFYFTKIASNSGDTIYQSEYKDGKFSEPIQMLGSLDSKSSYFDGVISPDGSYYILCIYDGENSLGGTDLYITFKDDKNVWSPLKNLGDKINTKFNEGSATISADGKYIFFSGMGTNHNYYGDSLSYADILNFNVKPQCGNSDIYWVDAKIIEDLKTKK